MQAKLYINVVKSITAGDNKITTSNINNINIIKIYINIIITINNINLITIIKLGLFS